MAEQHDDERVRRIDAQALEWLLKLNDDADARSESAFRAWLHIDPDHEAAYACWRLEWEALEGISAEQRLALRPQPAGKNAAPCGWLRRVQDVCADFWLAHPARRLALGGALCLLAGLFLLGGLGRYLG